MFLQPYVLFVYIIQTRICLIYSSFIASNHESFSFGNIINITADMPDEQRLFYTLMYGYEKSVRPTKQSSEAVAVQLGISLTQIMDIVS